MYCNIIGGDSLVDMVGMHSKREIRIQSLLQTNEIFQSKLRLCLFIILVCRGSYQQ